MRIAFAAIYDLDDINRGSGTYYQIYNEIKKQKIEIFKIGPLDIKFPVISKIFRYISKRILIIGSILPILISPISANEKELSNEVFEKGKAAMLYGMGLCAINNGNLSRKNAEKFIIEEMIKDYLFEN